MSERDAVGWLTEDERGAIDCGTCREGDAVAYIPSTPENVDVGPLQALLVQHVCGVCLRDYLFLSGLTEESG